MTNEAQAKPKWPTWKQVGALLGAAIVLGAGGCGLFVNSKGDALATIGASAFVTGVVLFLTGFIELLIRIVRSIAGK
jgi:hypothetical protein